MMNEIPGSAKLICDYCQRWQVRRFRGVFRNHLSQFDGPGFFPNLEYRCTSCGAVDFTYDEPKPPNVEEMLTNQEREGAA